MANKRMIFSLLPALAAAALLTAPVSADHKPGHGKAPAAKPSAGQLADNAATTAKVKSALLADKVAPGMAINVNTSNGVVTLKGEVESAQQKTRAGQVAMKVSGVKKVVNQLVVKAPKQ